MSVVDRGGLERCACECYAVLKKELARLLPPVAAGAAQAAAVAG